MAALVHLFGRECGHGDRLTRVWESVNRGCADDGKRSLRCVERWLPTRSSALVSAEISSGGQLTPPLLINEGES
jgi:hypothetical protein